MTLKEAVEVAETFLLTTISLMPEWVEMEKRAGLPPDSTGIMQRRIEALRIVLDTARQHIDDTAEIPLPCSTCWGKKEIVCEWHDGTAALSPCPTCVVKPVEVLG